MISIKFHPQAEAEFIAAARYYESQQKNLGQRFISSVEAGIARIKRIPHLFPVITKNIRQCLTRTFPFGIVFRDTEEQIEIIAVMHLNVSLDTGRRERGRKRKARMGDDKGTGEVKSMPRV